MKLRFTKMHGAGNDFVVLDATRAPLQLTRAQLRHLGDRRFGVGADQILVVEPQRTPGVDFRYRIFNNTGDEVEHCGNGARCFVRYVHDQGLTTRPRVRVETVNNLLELHLQPDGRVTVDMNRPVFDHAAHAVRRQRPGRGARAASSCGRWTWPTAGRGARWPCCRWATRMPCSAWTTSTPRRWPSWARCIERTRAFPRKVNAGFLQVLDRSQVGCASTSAAPARPWPAAPAPARPWWPASAWAGWTAGGRATPAAGLLIEWAGRTTPSVLMTGPAETVFEGEIEL
jgi:diaminopimelate epimerase